MSAETSAGSPAWSLIERATSWKCDLVVLGSQGRGRFARALLGSVSQKVLHEASCSVRIGRPPHLRGLPDPHAVPGFSTLAGLVLYAAADPIDIRSIGPSYQPTERYSGTALLRRLFKVAKEYF